MVIKNKDCIPISGWEVLSCFDFSMNDKSPYPYLVFKGCIPSFSSFLGSELYKVF